MTSNSRIRASALLLPLLLGSCIDDAEIRIENCRQLARSIESNHSRYWNELLLRSRLNSVPKRSKNSKSEMRKFNDEMLAVLEKRREFLKDALFGPDDSPLRCNCSGFRLEDLRTIGQKEIAALTSQIEATKQPL